jgi:hypothetical protein
VCVCSLSYQACNALAPYCHLRSFWLYQTSSHYLINGRILREGGIIKCVFWFTLQILSEMFIILRRNGRDIIINVHGSSREVPDILVTLQRKLNFLNTSSENFSNNELHENPYSRSRVVPCRWIDMTTLIIAFRNFANAPEE